MADGLFGNIPFGVTREDVLRQRTADLSKQFRERTATQAAALPRNEQGIFSAFANIGNQISGGDQAQLTGQEESSFRLMESANRRVQELKDSPEFATLNPQEQAFRMQEEMARAALDAGDINTGTQMLRQTFEQRQAARATEAQVTDLETEADVGAQTAEDRIAAKGLGVDVLQEQLNAAQNKFGNFVRITPNGFDIANPIQGRFTDGRLETTDGEILTEGFVPADYALKLMDLANDEAAARSRGGGGSKPHVLMTAAAGGASGLKASRVLRDSVNANRKILDGVVGLTEEVVGAGFDPTVFTSPAGTFNKAVNNIFNAAKGAYQGVFAPNSIEIRDDQGNVTGSTTLKSIADQINIPVPTGIEAGGDAAARYKANVMRLLYADALAFESGARQLSDADIKNAAQRNGVDSGNIGTVLRTMTANMRNTVDKFNTTVDTLAGSASALGIDPLRMKQFAFGTQTPMKGVAESFADIDDRIAAIGVQESPLESLEPREQVIDVQSTIPEPDETGVITLPGGSTMTIIEG